MAPWNRRSFLESITFRVKFGRKNNFIGTPNDSPFPGKYNPRIPTLRFASLAIGFKINTYLPHGDDCTILKSKKYHQTNQPNKIQVNHHNHNHLTISDHSGGFVLRLSFVIQKSGSSRSRPNRTTRRFLSRESEAFKD